MCHLGSLDESNSNEVKRPNKDPISDTGVHTSTSDIGQGVVSQYPSSPLDDTNGGKGFGEP